MCPLGPRNNTEDLIRVSEEACDLVPIGRSLQMS